MHPEQRKRHVLNGGEPYDGEKAVFSTLRKPLTASDLFIFARTKAFFGVREVPILCCGKGSSACQDVLSGEPLCALP